jgi:Cdc6-like AAA superfamily ATPase
MDRHKRELLLQTAFRPATPINSMELFAGRQLQSRALFAATNQNGRHAVLFGERGVGKTSLANVLFFLIERPGWPNLTPIVNCSRTDSYGTLWGRVFGELTRLLQKMGDSGQPLEVPKETRRLLRLASEAFFDGITMDAVKTVLSEIGEISMLVVVLDEFDTLESNSLRQEVADTIKYLSDRNCPCTIILVGVSDDVDGLIEDHRSIERCLAQVNMPRMSRDELEEIVVRCLKRADMSAEPAALHEISRISSGLPHYAHLIGLYSGLRAAELDSTDVASAHVTQSLPAAIENSHHTVKTAYIRAIESSQHTAKYREVLTACAMTHTNELGFFSPSDVREPLSLVLRKPARIEAFARHLHTFCSEDGGPVLRRQVLKKRPQFRFINPLMQPYALMRALADKLITEEDLKATRDPDDPQKRLF